MALDLVGWYYDFRINGQRFRKSTGVKNTGRKSETKALQIQEEA